MEAAPYIADFTYINPFTLMMINIVFLIGAIIMFVLYSLPRSKKYQNYLYNEIKTTDFVILGVIVVVVWFYFLFMFHVPNNPEILEKYEHMYLNIRLVDYAIIPFWLQLLFPALLLGQLFWNFVYYQLKAPGVYLSELNNINRFTTFIMYNIEYYHNDKKIIDESLDGIEEDMFYNDVKAVYGMDVSKEERFHLLSDVYSFSFLSMFFSLFLITLEKGVSEQSLLALDTVKKEGDRYYTNMVGLYRAKKGAIMVIFFINVMMVIMLGIMRNALSIGFIFYIYDNYLLFMAYVFGLVGLLCWVCIKYKSSKLITEEGRYV